jgi:uncharacterized protein
MKILVDSSVLIEYKKGNKTELLENLFNGGFDLCINDIIFSEFIYQHLGLMSSKSPITIREQKKIKKYLEIEDIKKFLDLFTSLDTNNKIMSESFELMKDYNLLPNDALILSTCIYYDIQYLASFDSDFIIPCKSENIFLLK